LLNDTKAGKAVDQLKQHSASHQKLRSEDKSSEINNTTNGIQLARKSLRRGARKEAAITRPLLGQDIKEDLSTQVQ
jgi:hypothetical protein